MLKKFGLKLPKNWLKRYKILGPKNDIQRDSNALDVPETRESISFRKIFDDIKSNWVDIRSLKKKH